MSLSIIATNLFAQTGAFATDVQSRTAVIFGLGTLVKPVERHGMTIDKVFFEKSR